MQKTTRQSTAKKWTILALILFLLVAVVAGTYTRYETVGRGTGTVQAAQWAVAIKSGDTTLNSTTQPITFAVQNNSNVVPNKTAPDVTAVATIELDLTGTEVAVDFDAVIDQTALSSFGQSGDKLSLAVAVNGTAYTSGTTQTIALENNSAFTAANGKKTVTLTLTWENDDENNVDDTATGVAAPTLTIPVTLTAKQHIANS